MQKQSQQLGMSMKTILILTGASVLLLAGCQSVSEVTQLGQNRYMVDATTRGGFLSHGETTALAVGKAREFCAGQNKQLETEDTKTAGARGWTPVDSTVMFKCIK